MTTISTITPEEVKAAYRNKARAEETITLIEAQGIKIIDRADLTDVGNARRFSLLYEDVARYCYPWKKWVIWNGKYWEKDKTGQIYRFAKSCAETILKEANMEQGDLRERLRKHGTSSKSATRLKAMVTLAESEERIWILPEIFDTNKMILNVLNGEIDLYSGTFKEHNKNNYFTKISKIEYNISATCPLWLRFMNTITVGDKELEHYLQKLAGKILTGLVLDKELYIFHGKKDTGKTTFVETIAYLMEEYSETLEIEAFMKKTRGGIPNDIAALSGKRFVFIDEPDFGDKLSEGLIKKLTGLGTINARFLNEEFFKFKPEFKIVISCNSQPDITDKDQAIWGRVRCVPFRAKIINKDIHLQEKLKTESPGILNWMIQGCIDWQREGMGLPDCINKATEEYKEDMDTLSDFFNICCEKNSQAKIPHEFLYTAFKLWAKAVNRYPMSKKVFTQVCENRDFDRTDTIWIEKRRYRGFVGITLTEKMLQCVQEFLASPDNEYDIVRTVGTHLHTFCSSSFMNEPHARDVPCVPSVLCVPAYGNTPFLPSVPSVPSVLSFQEIISKKLHESKDKLNKPDSVTDYGRFKRTAADEIELHFEHTFKHTHTQFPERSFIESMVQNYCKARGWE